MLAALRRLLDAVADSEQGLRQFNGDQELRKIALALYVAMLKMIEACINSLLHESFGRPVELGGRSNVLTTLRNQAYVRLHRGAEDYRQENAEGHCGPHLRTL